MAGEPSEAWTPLWGEVLNPWPCNHTKSDIFRFGIIFHPPRHIIFSLRPEPWTLPRNCGSKLGTADRPRSIERRVSNCMVGLWYLYSSQWVRSELGLEAAKPLAPSPTPRTIPSLVAAVMGFVCGICLVRDLPVVKGNFVPKVVFNKGILQQI